MKKFLMILVALAMSACAAPADTSLILKPSAEQIKAAKTVDNKECPVTGEKIGSMGKGPVVVYKGKAVELCCSGCMKTFAKDPAKYLKVAEGSTADSVTAPAKADHSSHM